MSFAAGHVHARREYNGAWGVRRMRKGWLISLSIVISAALVGAALLACMQLLRGLLSSEALRCGAETFRAGSTPLALMSAIFV